MCPTGTTWCFILLRNQMIVAEMFQRLKSPQVKQQTDFACKLTLGENDYDGLLLVLLYAVTEETIFFSELCANGYFLSETVG